jgi:hypothetical protein
MSDVIQNAYDPENLDVLRRLIDGGDTLTKSRNTHFSVGFAEEEAALSFTRQMHDLGYESSFEYKEQFAPLSWDATVVVSLVPSEVSIGEFELLLERTADPLCGKNDGWFCQEIIDNPDVSQSSENRL